MKSISTLVLGASENTDRYSNEACRLLRFYNHSVMAIGAKPGMIEDVKIVTEFPENQTVDTVTLYINPSLQAAYEEKIINLKPKRVIFNPGTENISLQNLLEENGIEVIEACTLVMLKTNQY